MKTAAKDTFHKPDPKIKKSYITVQTWALIQERQDIFEGKKEGNLNEAIKKVKS